MTGQEWHSLGVIALVLLAVFFVAYLILVMCDDWLEGKIAAAEAAVKSAALATDRHWDDVAALSLGDELSRRRDQQR